MNKDLRRQKIKKFKEIKMENRVTPRGLIRYARDYFEVYKILQEKEPRTLILYQVKFFLLCHAIELALKSKLRSEGFSIKKLKKLGHDLNIIIDNLTSITNIPLPQEYLHTISNINLYYKTKQFEYFQKGYKELVDIKQLESIAESIIKIFERLIFITKPI